MNTSLANLSATQLRRAAAIKDRIQSLEKELAKLLGASTAAPVLPANKRKRMSKKARALISAAQKARWAKLKAARKK